LESSIADGGRDIAIHVGVLLALANRFVRRRLLLSTLWDGCLLLPPRMAGRVRFQHITAGHDLLAGRYPELEGVLFAPTRLGMFCIKQGQSKKRTSSLSGPKKCGRNVGFLLGFRHNWPWLFCDFQDGRIYIWYEWGNWNGPQLLAATPH